MIMHLHATHKVIEKQYPKERYLMTGERVKFSRPKATLSYKARPAAGWKLIPEKTPEKVRITNFLVRTFTIIPADFRRADRLPGAGGAC